MNLQKNKLKNFFKLQINPNRIYGLDILRASAILFVVFSHSSFLLPKILIPITFYSLDGVTIFFVLSGYLIGGILITILKSEGATFKSLLNFWVRRWFRTLPNYFLILSILTVLSFLYIDDFHFDEIKMFFIFSQNLFSNNSSFFPEAWSLSVEEWFYLLIPIILFTTIKIFKVSYQKQIFFTTLFILILITVFRFYQFYDAPFQNTIEWQRSLHHQVFTRLDSLMYGVIGAYISFFYTHTWKKLKLPLFIIGIFLFLFEEIIEQSNISNFYYCVFSISVTSFATLLVLPYLSNLKKGNGFLFYILTYISLVSYSMYLINLSLIKDWLFIRANIFSLFPSDSLQSTLILYILYWVITLLISIIIYKFFELPIMKLRDKIKF